MRRVVFDGWRLAGLLLADAELTTSSSATASSTLASLNSARLRDVVFEGCELDEAFLGRGTMRAVRFDGCRMLRADFSGASLARVDLRGSELDPAGDVSGLRGAMIDVVQLAGLAGRSGPCGRHPRGRRLMPTETLDHRRVLVVISGLMLVMLLASLDQTIVSTALPTIVQRPRRARAPLVGRHGVPAGGHRGHAAVRQARRPLRPQDRAPGRAGALPGRLGAVRAGAGDDRADRVPRSSRASAAAG